MAHLFYFPTKFTDIQMEYNKVVTFAKFFSGHFCQLKGSLMTFK